MIFDSVTQLLGQLSGGASAHGSIFVQVSQKSQRTTKGGKPYLEVQLADVANSFSIKIWDNVPWYRPGDELTVVFENAWTMTRTSWVSKVTAQKKPMRCWP